MTPSSSWPPSREGIPDKRGRSRAWVARQVLARVRDGVAASGSRRRRFLQRLGKELLGWGEEVAQQCAERWQHAMVSGGRDSTATTFGPPPPMVLRPRLPLSAFDAEIGELVASNPDQMTFFEYRHVKDCLLARGPCRLLVFGVGLDSGLWTRINQGGTTLFLENSEDWIRAMRERHAGQSLAIQSVAYTTRLKSWESQLHAPEELGSPPVDDKAWDVILVDGPMGWDPENHPGRTQSIFWAARLAGHVRNPPTIVLVHDFHRVVEQMASWRFLGRSCLVGTIEHLAHFCIPCRHRIRWPWRARPTLGLADIHHFSTELAKLKVQAEGRGITV